MQKRTNNTTKAANNVAFYDLDSSKNRAKKGRKKDPNSKAGQLRAKRRKKAYEKNYDKRVAPLNSYNKRCAEDIAESERLVFEQFDFKGLLEVDEIVKRDLRGIRLTPVERSQRILEYMNLLRDGYSLVEAEKKFKEKYQCTDKVAYKWRAEALAMLDKYTLKDAEKVRSQQILRLENLLQKAVERNDLKTANSICETINKVCGLYDKKAEVVVAPVVHFSFGGDSNIQTSITQVPEAIAEVDTEIIDELNAYNIDDE